MLPKSYPSLRKILADPFVVAALLTGMTLRFVGLGERTFWVDEAHQALTATSELAGLDYWAGAAGDFLGLALQEVLFRVRHDELIARLPAAFFGSLIPLATAWLAATVTESRRVLRMSAWLASISFPLVYYAQEARGYSAATFFGVLALIGLAKLRLIPRQIEYTSRVERLRSATVIFSLGALWSANFGFLLMAVAWALYMLAGGIVRLSGLIAGATVLLAATGPLAVYRYTRDGVAGFHGNAGATFHDPFGVFENFFRVSLAPSDIGLLLAAALTLLGSYLMLRDRVGRFILLPTLLSVPLIVWASAHNNFPIHSRYFLFLLPLMIVAFAWATEVVTQKVAAQKRLVGTMLTTIGFAVVAVPQTIMTARYTQTPMKLTHPVDGHAMRQIVQAYEGPIVFAPVRLGTFAALYMWEVGDLLQKSDRVLLDREAAVLDAAFWQRQAVSRWAGAYGSVQIRHRDANRALMGRLGDGATVVDVVGSTRDAPCAKYDDICPDWEVRRLRTPSRRSVTEPTQTEIWTMEGVILATVQTEPGFDHKKWRRDLHNKIR